MYIEDSLTDYCKGDRLYIPKLGLCWECTYV